MRLNPTFLLSATDPAHFPDALKTHNAPEVAFLGRSNVGKSSLINALLGSRQAHVSSTPGRTRAINFFALHEGVGLQKKLRPELILADLPGYGYAKISKSISAEWPKFIEPYLAERQTLALCVCLIDTNVPPQSNDAHLLDFIRQVERPFVVVGTKSDKLSSNQLNKSLALLKREHQLEEILPCSAKTSAGLKALWARMMLAGQK
ncbi:MAG: ribosome biogenesis GTP-binding protein YihA/YsxC [Acidobacteriaceae bacterium]|jgi:GTP-binding protein|nr:ribosome biogenesis GTP-binding protein YihA/YsxC [Acidobacteriaceae bacterium]